MAALPKAFVSAVMLQIVIGQHVYSHHGISGKGGGSAQRTDTLRSATIPRALSSCRADCTVYLVGLKDSNSGAWVGRGLGERTTKNRFMRTLTPAVAARHPVAGSAHHPDH